MKYFIAIICVCLCHYATAQTSDIEWAKNFGGSDEDVAYSVVQCRDSGYFIVGVTESTDSDVVGNHGYKDIFALKLSASGNVVWKKCIGGNYDDYAWNAIEVKSGGFIIAGETGSTSGDVSGTAGYNDAWIVRLSDSGRIEWQQTFGGSDEDAAYSIKETSDSGFIVAGLTNSSDGIVVGKHPGATSFAPDVWLLKLKADGELQWTKCLGGEFEDFANTVIEVHDSNYVVAASTMSADGDVAGGGHHGLINQPDYWLIKVDRKDGSIIWQKCFGGSNFDYGFSVAENNDNSLVACGSTASFDGDITGRSISDENDLIIKTSTAGVPLWKHTIGGNYNDRGQSIKTTSDGGNIIAGYEGSKDLPGDHGGIDFWVTKLDASGSIDWQRCLGGSLLDDAYDVQQTFDGGYIVVGKSESNNGDVKKNYGKDDFWIVKLKPTTGIADIVYGPAANIKVYPTVTNKIINVDMPYGYDNSSVRLYNMMGQEVKISVSMSGLKKIVQIEDALPGMYILQIVNDNQKSAYKIIYKP